MSQPLVTIAVPTFSRLEYLVEAVESALAQTWPTIEVLVGDDGVTDEIPRWCADRAARDPRLRYHRNRQTLGFAGNLNAIIRRAAGEFVIPLGDDDRLLPECVEVLVRNSEANTAVVFCNHDVIDADGQHLAEETARITKEFHRDTLPAGPLTNAAVCAWQIALLPSAALIRRRELVRLGFHEELSSPDVEFFIRLATEGGAFTFVPAYLVEHRIHRRSLTASGLRHDRLVSRLLDIPAREDVEPAKRALIERLIVTAVSRSLEQGDARSARRFLDSDYYPSELRRWSRAVQRACATMPAAVGAPIYRMMLRLKQTVPNA